jgi:hypothetical protein
MESDLSETRKGQNNISSDTPDSDTPDGYERAGLRPAAVAGSGISSELRPVPSCLNGASAAGRARTRVGISTEQPATATPPGMVAYWAWFTFFVLCVLLWAWAVVPHPVI